jgi:hypothetical protein
MAGKSNNKNKGHSKNASMTSDASCSSATSVRSAFEEWQGTPAPTVLPFQPGIIAWLLGDGKKLEGNKPVFWNPVGGKGKNTKTLKHEALNHPVVIIKRDSPNDEAEDNSSYIGFLVSAI